MIFVIKFGWDMIFCIFAVERRRRCRGIGDTKAAGKPVGTGEGGCYDITTNRMG